jgi:organic hydroperoxide reductase OsmC/OhrA
MSEEEHKYELKSRWVREKIVSIAIDGKNSFNVATPPDFWPESPSDALSPEDLFLASAVSCYGVTLYGVSQRFHAEMSNFYIAATGTLQKGERGWEFGQISMNAKIIVPTTGDKKKMSKAAEHAHTYCVVTNSMKCPVHLEFEVVVGKSE